MAPALRLEKVNVYRAPGLREVRRNDVVVVPDLFSSVVQEKVNRKFMVKFHSVTTPMANSFER
jgi:hypothetical protein